MPEPQERVARALLNVASSADVKYNRKSGLLTITTRGSIDFERRKTEITPDGKHTIIDQKAREPSVFDDTEDPEDPEEIVYPDPADPFDPDDDESGRPWTAKELEEREKLASLLRGHKVAEIDGQPVTMSSWSPKVEETATDLVVIDKETGEITKPDPVLDILLNSAAKTSDRVAVLVNVCAGAVYKGLEGGDLSPDLRAAEVLRGTLGMLAEIRGIANVAELQIAMQMNECNTRYLMPDGGSADLAEELQRAMPIGNTSAGRAHQIARFLTEGSGILLTAGVKPAEISLILQDGKLSKLAVVSSAVKRVHEDVSLNTESKLVEYRQILADAVTMAARKLQRKYGRHRFPPAPATMQRDGTEWRIVFWSGIDQWESQISPRLTMLDFDAGREDAAVTPDMILNSDGDLTKLFQVAVESNLKRRAVLGVMAQADGPITIPYIASILPELTQNQVSDVLCDLARWSLVIESKSGNQTVYKLNRKESDDE